MPKRRDSAIFSAKSTLKLPGERTKPLVPTGKIRVKNPKETFPTLTEAQIDNLCGKGKWPVYLDFHEDMFRLSTSEFLGHARDVVKEIDFSSNLLTEFHSASHLTKLRRLNLSNNELVDARLSGMVSLEFLSLSRNKLQAIPDMVSLRSLVHLDLSSNTCQRGYPQLQHLKSLRVLDLSCNSLELTPSQLYHFIIIHLKRLPKLEYVSFEDNPVSQTLNYRPFVISELPKLKYLDWKEVSKDERNKAEQMDFKTIKDNIPPSSPSSSGSSSASLASVQKPTPVGEPVNKPKAAAPPPTNSKSLASFDTPSVPPPQPPGPSQTQEDVLNSLDDILNEITEETLGGASSNKALVNQPTQEFDPLDDVLGLLDEPSSPTNPQHPPSAGRLPPSSFDEKFAPPPDMKGQDDPLQYFDDLLDVLEAPNGAAPPSLAAEPPAENPPRSAPAPGGGGEDPLQYFDDLFEILNENPGQGQASPAPVANTPPKKEPTPDDPQLFDELTSILEDNEWSSSNKNNPSLMVPPPTQVGGPATPPPPGSVDLPPPIASVQPNDLDDELLDVLGDILESPAPPPQPIQQRAAPEQDGSDLMDELDMILQDFPLDPVSSNTPSPSAQSSTQQQHQNLDDEIARLLGEPTASEPPHQSGSAIKRVPSPRAARPVSPKRDLEMAALLSQLEGDDNVAKWEEQKKAEMESRYEEERLLREAEEKARRDAEEEALRMEEERRRHQEEERLRQIEEERRRKEEEDRRLEQERQMELERIKAEEALLAREEEERQRRLEEERLIREAEEKRREEEAQRREEARRRLEEERKRRDEEARLKAEEELRRREEEEARIKEEEERRRRAAEERLREEEERRRREAEERRRHEEEQRILEEQERRRRQEEEERRREEEERLRREEEERREQERLEARRKAEEELAKRRAELEERKRLAEQKRLQEQEELRARKEANEELMRQKEREREEAEQRRKQEDEEERQQWLARMAQKEAGQSGYALPPLAQSPHAQSPHAQSPQHDFEVDQYLQMQTMGANSFGLLPEPEEANLPRDLVNEMKQAPAWELKSTDVATQDRLGSGTFGSVYRGVWNHRPVTVKTLNCQRFDQDFLFRLKQEVAPMVNMEHPNVMQFLGLVSDATLQTVGEFVHGVPLYGFLRNKAQENLSGDVCIDILQGIAGGLEYLHNNNVIHRALKSKNVMMTEEGVPKLRDFGFGEIKDAVLASGSIVAPNYSAPEILVRIGKQNGAPVSKAVDIFSLGMLAWEVFTRQTPLGDLLPKQVLKAILVGERPPILPCVPIILQRLIPTMWQGEAGKRPTIDKIVRIFNAPHEKLLQYEPSYTGTPSVVPPSASASLAAAGSQSFSGNPGSPGRFLGPGPGTGGSLPSRSATFSEAPPGSAEDKVHHVLKRLIDLLSAPYPQSQVKALKATANLAPTLSNPIPVRESGIVPLIIKLHNGPDQVKENVLITLYAICSNELLCDQAMDAGVMQVCASFMHTDNNILVLNSTKVVTKIAELPVHRPALRAVGIIAPLLQLCDHANESVKQQALLCLCQVCEDDACLQEFVNLGGAAKLSQLVRGNHPGIVLRSFVLLSMLYKSPDPQVQQAYRDSGVISRFVAFLKSTTPMLLMEGTKGMIRFSTMPAYREDVARMGGIAPLIAVLTQENSEASYNSCIALKNFAQEETYRAFIRKSGGLAVLLAIMQRRDSENAKELQVAAEVLSLLVSDVEAGEQLLAQGSLPLLLGNLTSPVAEVRRASLTCLSGAVASDAVAEAAGKAVSAHTFTALLNSSDEDVPSNAVKVMARISEKSVFAGGLQFDILNLVCGQLQSQDQEASISAAIVLSLAAVQGNNEVGKSILNSQTVHAFLGQLPIAADYQLVNLLKGTSALVSEVQFGHAAMMQGVGDAIAAVLKRKIPLFCSTAFRILLTLGTSPESKLRLVESPVNSAMQDLISDPATDPRLIMAAEKVMGTLHS